MDASISRIKDIDLDRTLIMLKRNEENHKLRVESEGCSILNKALEMSTDLEEEEQLGSQGHKDLDSPVVAKKGFTLRRKKKLLSFGVVLEFNSNLITNEREFLEQRGF